MAEGNSFLKIGFLLVALVCALAVVGLAISAFQPQNPQIEFKEMPRFENYEKLAAYFSESRSQSYGLVDAVVKTVAMPFASVQYSMSAGSAENSSADFSRTNVQVEGVDEADIVKTDGKYIYNFSKNRLIITEAYPIEGSEIVSMTDLEGISPLEMFIEGDRLLVFGSSSNGGYYGAKVSTLSQRYGYGYGGDTLVQIYDITDRASPSLEKEFSFEGSYLTSRLIGKNAYFVINSYPRYSGNGFDGNDMIPMMSVNGAEQKIAEPSEIGYLPPMPAESFVTLASINLDSLNFENETIAGSASSVFASEESIYLAGTAWIAPETPIMGGVERVIVGDSEKTIINKFGLDNGKVGFLGQGQVPGHVLNQFSMDEFEGNFRIATTAGQVSQMASQTSNNLYVLDSEMNTIGKLEGLAPGEKIYSARFMGKKAYMVTFKKVDPLFVIDLSNPSSPQVLGKLKIPGYSDYLHPIDENHIIGIGKDTIESYSGNFAWYQGLKIAVFDVSDVANPKEMHKIVIGDRGTDSFALQNHKAFLYDREKELLVLPISLAEIPAEQKRPAEEQAMSPVYGTQTFQGAFVYRLTLENGFEELGRITHVSPEEDLKSGYYYNNDSQVQRSLFIGNVLYTLSEKMLKANSLSDLSELKEFNFG